MYRPNAPAPTSTPGVGRGREWDMNFTRQGVCNKCETVRQILSERSTWMESKAMTDPPQLPSATEGRPFEALQRWRDTKDGPKDYYKTKLCEKFATLGRCPYDDRCTYAHGYEELRPYPRHHAAMEVPFPPESSEKGTAGISEAHSTASDKPRPRDTISDSYPYPPQMTSSIGYVDKVKALCSSLGIGSPSVKPGALQEAMADLKSRAILKGNLYADDIGGYV